MLRHMWSCDSGGPCPSDMGDAIICAKKFKLKTGVARLWDHRLPHGLKLWVAHQRKWVTRLMRPAKQGCRSTMINGNH